MLAISSITNSSDRRRILTAKLLHPVQLLKSTKHLAGIYLLKVNNRNTGTRCEICSKLTIKTPER